MAGPCSGTFTVTLTSGGIDATLRWRDVQQTQETRRDAPYVWNFLYTVGDPRATQMHAEWLGPIGEPLPTIEAVTHEGFALGPIDLVRKGKVYFRTPEPSQQTTYTLQLLLFQV